MPPAPMLLLAQALSIRAAPVAAAVLNRHLIGGCLGVPAGRRLVGLAHSDRSGLVSREESGWSEGATPGAQLPPPSSLRRRGPNRGACAAAMTVAAAVLLGWLLLT